MTWTFSSLVDSLIIELQRPDKRDLITSSLNGAIRDLHLRPADRAGAAPVRYAENMVELQVTLTPPAPFLWQIPSPATFMGIEAMKFTGTNDFLSERRPSTMRNLATDFTAKARYYRSGSYYAFDGVWESQQLDIAYYTYLPRLFYIDPALRTIVWDASQGMFVREIDMLPPTEVQLAKETNWALERHAETLRAGVKAKVNLATNNLEVGKIHYSAFESGRAGVQSAETTA